MKTIFIITLFLIAETSLAVPAGTKGKDGNFKVSEKSLRHLGVKFTDLTGPGPWTVPKSALVRIKLTQGVYRQYQDELTFVIVKVMNVNGENVTIHSDDLESGDEVAVSGVNFLRMAETDLNSETVDNCAH